MGAEPALAQDSETREPVFEKDDAPAGRRRGAAIGAGSIARGEGSFAARGAAC
jgi:hypothetical protein